MKQITLTNPSSSNDSLGTCAAWGPAGTEKSFKHVSYGLPPRVPIACSSVVLEAWP